MKKISTICLSLLVAAAARAQTIKGPLSKSVGQAPAGITLNLVNPAAPAPQAAPLPSLVSPSLPGALPSPVPAIAPVIPQAALETVVETPAAARTPETALEGLENAGQALREQAKSGDQAPVLQKLYGERGLPGGADASAASGAGVPAAGLEKAPKLGIDLSAIDRSVRPQEDFFRYVTGTWLKNFKMPADKSRFGAFDALREKSEVAVKGIIRAEASRGQQPGSDGQKIADLYRSFMDWRGVEVKGLEPVREDLARIEAIASKDELPAVFARNLGDGIRGPVYLGVDIDKKDTSRYVADMGQAGLGLPDRDYYFKDDEKSVKIQDKYKEYLTRLFALSGEEKAAEKAEAVYALEKALAEHQWTRVANRDPEKTYNKVAVKDLAALAPGFDWAAYLAAGGVPAGEAAVIVNQPSYLAGFSKVLAEQPIESWKLYLKARALDGAAPYLSKAFVEASFDYKGRTLSGQPEMRPRWKRGVDLVNGGLGELIGKTYVRKNFPESSKRHMVKLVENLRVAFAERIKSLPWMGEETKKKALEKLAKFTPKIGYPDRWRDYSGLEIRRGDLLGNVRRSNRFDHAREMAKLGRPIDRGEWLMYPQTVNAYYLGVMNEIVFPAAILQPPFFDPEADDAVNYGAIGAVIGHEMSHGFDDKGSKSNGDGMLTDWWTKEDRAEFEARAAKLAAQFDAMEPLPGQRINGKLTLGENIGDLGGVTVAYQAYRMSLRGREPPVIDGYTGDQRFFMGYAQVWRSAIRAEALALQLATDPHSPAEYRVNGLMPNLEPFARAFDAKEGDKMFLPEGERVRIW